MIFNFDLKTETLGLDRISSGYCSKEMAQNGQEAVTKGLLVGSLAQKEGGHRSASNTL